MKQWLLHVYMKRKKTNENGRQFVDVRALISGSPHDVEIIFTQNDIVEFKIWIFPHFSRFEQIFAGHLVHLFWWKLTFHLALKDIPAGKECGERMFISLRLLNEFWSWPMKFFAAFGRRRENECESARGTMLVNHSSVSSISCTKLEDTTTSQQFACTASMHSIHTYGVTFLTTCDRIYQSELDPRQHWKLCRVAVIHFLAVRANE